MAVTAAIGHLYGNTGLSNLLYDSDVIAAGTAQQILSGRDFDRGLYAMKLLDEVFNSLLLDEFGHWYRDRDIAVPPELMRSLQELQQEYSCTSPDSVCAAKLVDKLTKAVDKHFCPLLEEFRIEGRGVSATFALWDDFIQRVLLPVKMFLASTRKGDWKTYQYSKAMFLPLLFAGNRTTYASYMPLLLILMNRLPKEVMESFTQKGFIAKLSDGRFNGVWIDYALETTQNKALKGSGGLIGLTLKGPALARWFFARPITAQYSTGFHESICKRQNQKSPETVHHSTRKSEVNRWNTNVAKMKNMFDTGSYLHPFRIADLPTGLVNFATGAIAPHDIQESLVGALDKGEAQAETFVKDRLVW